MNVKEKKKQRSFRLSEGTYLRLEKIAKAEYRDSTNTVEALIERDYLQKFPSQQEATK
jgi:predicted DNA-binding protein